MFHYWFEAATKNGDGDKREVRTARLFVRGTRGQVLRTECTAIETTLAVDCAYRRTGCKGKTSRKGIMVKGWELNHRLRNKGPLRLFRPLVICKYAN